jgi:phytoene dehydrogenase-like protein
MENNMADRNQADAIVIGAGVGGLCAAARLTAAGYKVIVLEKSRYLGGRCSHRVRDGFTVTTGAIMIPMAENSAIRQAFDSVGAQMDMVETTGRMRYRLAHGDYDLPKTGGGLLSMIEFALEGDSSAAAELFQHFRDAIGEAVPDERMSFLDWLDRHTDNQAVKGLFQGFCAALMGTSLHEIPAAEFFRFLRYSSHGSRFGLARHGNGSLMEALAAAMEERGAEIRRRTMCRKILVEDNRAVGVEVHSGHGGTETLRADHVLSNAGPCRTISITGDEKLFAGSYQQQLEATPHEVPIIHYAFVCDEPLIDGFDGSLVFGNTRNLIYLEIPSIISPVLAPDGKFLHTAYGAPGDAANPDLREVARNTLQELEDNFPGMTDKSRFLVKARHSGQSPGMHRWAGFMMPVETPVQNLFNVGDGATSPGTIGTEGAASSARKAVELIMNTGGRAS